MPRPEASDDVSEAMPVDWSFFSMRLYQAPADHRNTNIVSYGYYHLAFFAASVARFGMTLGSLQDIDYLKYVITNLAYSIRRQGRAAVGGGRDTPAYLFGFRDVTGAELNPIFCRFSEEQIFRDYNHLPIRPARTLRSMTPADGTRAPAGPGVRSPTDDMIDHLGPGEEPNQAIATVCASRSDLVGVTPAPASPRGVMALRTNIRAHS